MMNSGARQTFSLSGSLLLMTAFPAEERFCSCNGRTLRTSQP